MRLITTTIFKEALAPMTISLVSVSLLLLLGRVLPLLPPLLRSGITLWEFVWFLLLLLPDFLMLTIPLAALFGVLLGFLRLSRDNELLGLFSCGIPPLSLIRPVILIGLAASAATLLVAAAITPSSKTHYRLFLQDVSARAFTQGIVPGSFLPFTKGITLYVQETSPDKHNFKGVFIKDDRKKETANLIFAQTGQLYTGTKGHKIALKLNDGLLNRINPEYTTTDTFEFQTYTVQLGIEGRKSRRGRGEMGLLDLKRRGRNPNTPMKKRLRYMAEFHKRLALPVGAFMLAMIGIPIGALSGTMGTSGGIASGIATFLGYYLLSAFAFNMAEAGSIPPWLGVWMPNVILGSAAFILLQKFFRHGISQQD